MPLELFDEWWQFELESSPARATTVGVTDHDHRWTDWSQGGIERRKHQTAEFLERARATTAEDEEDRLSLALLQRELEVRVAGHAFPEELLPISKMGGLHQDVARILSRMPSSRLGHFENVLARLDAVSVLVDQTIALMDEGVAAGVTPPLQTIDDVPDQLDALLTAPPDVHPFLGPFARGCPEAVNPGDFDDVRREATETLTESSLSALRRFRTYVAERYLPACRDSIAWSELPDGASWYAHLVEAFTTTNLTPQEIHDLGLDEVERIRSEMVVVEEEAGFGGRREDFLTFLRTDDRFFFVEPADLLAAYRDIAKRVDPELPRLFGTLPRLPYGVGEIPAHEAPSTTTAYYLRGATETGRPGWFMANTHDLRSRPSWEMEALTLHEAVPGHHLQIAIAGELEGLPEFRRFTGPTAYVEGWGLYAESLGTEMGFYADPFSRFGQLAYEMWRAVRLVVDTGIHAFGWGRQQAIDYFADNTGKAIHDCTVEVDRYIAWPAQALAYKLGELTFKRLRRRSAEELGDRFDIRRFHDCVLLAGALPLDVLEERVERWLAAQQAGGVT